MAASPSKSRPPLRGRPRNKLRIRSGDTVVVIAGRDKGTKGRVVRVLPAERKVVIEGVARVRRHKKKVGDTPGAIVEKEMPIDVSNVALWSTTENRRVKVRLERKDDGSMVRVDRKSGTAIDREAPAGKDKE
jgi:large subunit ribosomal protein L24